MKSLIIEEEAELELARSVAFYEERNVTLEEERTAQKEILDPLSIDILEGKVREGQTVKVDAKNGALAFNAN